MLNMMARIFTKAEAQQLVPILTELFAETRVLVEELLALRQDGLTLSINGSVIVDEDSSFRIQQLSALVQSRLQLVTAMGLEVRRVDGLVDIPALVQGEEGYYCWRFGEREIGYWHRADEGCTDRRSVEFGISVGY